METIITYDVMKKEYILDTRKIKEENILLVLTKLGATSEYGGPKEIIQALNDPNKTLLNGRTMLKISVK